MGLAFIDRLMRTDGYRALAVSMLATFSADPEFASSKDLLERVWEEPSLCASAPNDQQLPPVLSLLCTPSADPAEVTDAYRCVMALVAAQAVSVASAGLLNPLVKAATIQTGDTQLEMLNAVTAVCSAAYSASSAIPALDGAVRALIPAAVPLLARRDAGAFVALQALAALLGCVPLDEWRALAASFAPQVRTDASAALLALLSSKLGGAHRALGLLVVSHLTRGWGLPWAGAKLGPLSAGLARAELEVALHYASKDAPPVERTRIVTSCAQLLETLLDALMEALDGPAATGIAPDAILAYRAPLDEAAATMLSYFETRPTDPADVQLVVARPLAAWLVEQGDLPPGAEAALPALVALPDEAMPFLLPVFTSAALEPPMAAVLIQHDLPRRLVAFLSAQLPALVAAAKQSPQAQHALASACACVNALASAGGAPSFAPLFAALKAAQEQLVGTEAGEEAANAVNTLRAALPLSVPQT